MEKAVSSAPEQRELRKGQEVFTVVVYGSLLTGNTEEAESDIEELSYQEPAYALPRIVFRKALALPAAKPSFVVALKP